MLTDTTKPNVIAGRLPWDNIDTVLLDMDGTLLDLNYDNQLWNQELPRRYAAAQQISLEASQAKLFHYMASVRGTLNFYCLDHWAEFTGLDMQELHLNRTELIRYRPGAEIFLEALQQRQKYSVLVTNAHRLSLTVKDQTIGLSPKLNQAVSCHDYEHPKEDQQFWHRLAAQHPFDPTRTLFIDDNADVLNAAEAFGIEHLVTISQPDSQRPEREQLDFPAVNDLRDLL